MNLPPIKDYEYTAFLGEGATGQVYAAKQGDRPVALKILKRLAVNRQLIGYSVSRLRRVPPHPNVVDIIDFAVDGRPLYVVTSLHTHTTKEGEQQGYSLEGQCGSMDPELAWDIIRQVNEAGAHLHRHGVVHASLNPRNIMVADPDRPEVKVTDFAQGWVAEISHIDFSESYLYAPPEQLRAPQEMYEGQGTRWDVYAFGATAYRMLYRQFPRGNQWISRMREGAVAFHPLAYADVISGQPEVSWPGTQDGFAEQRQRVLEKCLQLDPADRYADLRDVLDHFKRIDREEKLALERREAQERERALSDKAETSEKRFAQYRKIAALLLGGLIVSFLFNITSETRLSKRRKEIKEIQSAATREVSESQAREERALNDAVRLKSNLTYSQATADAFLEFLLNAKNPNSPEYQSIDGYLSSAQEHYERVLRTAEGDPTLIVERLRAQLGLARIEAQLGEPEKAASMLNALVGEIQTLADQQSQVQEVQETLAGAQLEAGKAKMLAGMRGGALQSLQESVKVYNRLVTADPKNLNLKRKFGKALFFYGQQLARSGDLEQALRSQQSAMQVLESLAQSGDAREEDEYYLARCQFEVGLIRVWENEGIEAWEAFQLASQGYSRLMDQKPQIPEYRFQLARCYYYLGELAFQEKGDSEVAADARKAMLELLKLLLTNDEANRNYQFYLALVFADLAAMARDGGEREEAVENLSQAITVLTELHKEQPQDADVTYHLALVTAMEGDFLLDVKDTKGGVARFDTAEALFRKIDDGTASPGVPDHVYEFRRAAVLVSHGHALEMAQEASKAQEYIARAEQILQSLVSKRPKDGRIRDALEALRTSAPVETNSSSS